MQTALTKAGVKRVVVCPYCQRDAVKVTGKEIYPHRPDLYAKTFYECDPCDAYVGCHPGTDTPLGRLADPELREAKQRAHATFDPIWKSGRMSRSGAYSWLASQLGIKKSECHIGMFDVEQCRRVVEVCAGANHD